MAESLRQLVASFIVQVDPDGALKRGNAQVNALKGSLKSIDPVAKTTSLALSSGFLLAAASADRMTSSVAKAVASVKLLGTGAGGGALARLFGGGGLASGGGPKLLGAGADPLAGWRDLLGAGGGGRKGPSFGQSVDASSAGIGKALGGALSAVTSLQAGLAALAGGVVGSQVKALIDSIGGIGEEAAKLGVTNAEFQRLDVLAKQNATSVQALGAAFQIMARNVTHPSEQARAALTELGVSVKDSNGAFRSRSDLFFDIAGSLADVEDGTKRAALAQSLLGEGARQIAPLIANGRAGLEAQRAELEKLPIVSEAAIAAADHLGDRWAGTALRLKVVAADILERLVIPALELLTSGLELASAAIGKLVKWFNPWTHGVAALVVALSPLLSTMGALVALGGGWGALAKSVVGGLGKMVAAVAPALAAFLILEDLFVFFAGGKSLVGRGLEAAFGPGITKTVNDLRDAVKDLWGWITGENADLGKFKSMIDEISLALRLMIHNALAAVGIRDEAGLAGLEKYEAGQAERAGPARVPNAGGGASNFAFNPATGGFMQVPSTIPTPGGLSAGGTSYGPPPPPNAAPTSTSITIINPAPGEGMKLAGQVKGVLERDRNSDIANVQ